MEGFLRAYYTNLNPNATEEEILAYLASQGFEGMGNQPIEGGITTLQQNPMLLPQMGGEDPNTPFRGTGTGSILDFIKSGGLFGAATRGIGDLFQNFADKRAGRLDITPDSAIMPGRPQGAAEGSDAGFENTQSIDDFNADANLGTSDFGYI
tara:strand:- start:49 stop:504 length:456 start_codon:yes stop_codon:yes gene_type:complete